MIVPDLLNGSQYSSGWKPIARIIDENNQCIKPELDAKLKQLAAEFDTMKVEYDERITHALNKAAIIESSLSAKILELVKLINEKDLQIKRLLEENNKTVEENRSLCEKCHHLSNQLSESSKGFLNHILKKL